MKKQTLHWGLIGCGDISRRRVAPAIRDLHDTELTAVNRADSTLLAPFAREFGARKWFSGWRDLIAEPEIDAVYIATPVNLHAEMTCAAAQAGKHVLCEKPMALTDDECVRMIEACRENGVLLGIAYYRHFYPVIRRIADLLAQGAIGDVILIQMDAFSQFDRSPDEPRAWLLDKTKSGGGPMMDFGCHRIEVMTDLMGPVERVRPEISTLRYVREVEDTAMAWFTFQNGARGQLTVTHAVFEPRDTLSIYGTLGSLHVPVLNEGNLHIRDASGERIENLPPHPNLHQPLIEDFNRAVIENRPPRVDGETGLHVNEILTKIYTNSF